MTHLMSFTSAKQTLIITSTGLFHDLQNDGLCKTCRSHEGLGRLPVTGLFSREGMGCELTQASCSHVGCQHDGVPVGPEFLAKSADVSRATAQPQKPLLSGQRQQGQDRQGGQDARGLAQSAGLTASTQSRSSCSLSPWMESAGQPSCRSRRVTSSQPRLVSQKARMRLPSICCSSSRHSRAYFSSSAMNSKLC